jgi:hypothetical protein
MIEKHFCFHNQISMKGKKSMGQDPILIGFPLSHALSRKRLCVSASRCSARGCKRKWEGSARSPAVAALFAGVPFPRQRNEEVENSGAYRYFRTSTHTLWCPESLLGQRTQRNIS